MHTPVMKCVRRGVCAASMLAAPAFAADLELIYSEIPGACSNPIHGARDLAGQPVAANWTAILGLAVRTETDEWVVRGFSNLGTDLQSTLVRGTGSSGMVFMQEGQPIEGGGKAGEVWDFFIDAPAVSWNAAGHLAHSPRARGGVTTNNEKVSVFDGVAHTIVHQQGDPNNSAGCTANAFGNSIGSVQVLDSGTVRFGNTGFPTGCSGTVLFHGLDPLAQTNITQVDDGAVGNPEIVDSIDYDNSAFTRDGAHWATIVGTNNPNTAMDEGLMIDNDMILREGLAIGSSSVVVADIIWLSYASNNDLYVRGDTATDTDWAWRSGTLIAATGDSITTGSAELWGDAFSSFLGNGNGDWVLVGNTSVGNADVDSVVVLNGEQVIVREGDPVDVDGNGVFDDNAYIRTFAPNAAYLTEGNVLYLNATLRDTLASTGTNLGDAFIRVNLNPACDANIAITGASATQVDIDDLLAVISAWGPCPAPPAACPANIAGPCNAAEVNIDDLLAVISAWGPCP